MWGDDQIRSLAQQRRARDDGRQTDDYLAATDGLSDSQVPDLTTAVSYEHSWLGLATETAVDPTGLNLRTRTSYEQSGSGWLRRTTRTLPAAVWLGLPASTAGTTYGYYAGRSASCRRVLRNTVR